MKEAIHAPLNVQWYECTYHNVFVPYEEAEYVLGQDKSPDSIQGALPQVIEATNRVLISNGDWDFLIPTNGTLLSIQNMTWNGKLGFQEAPSQDFVVPIPHEDDFFTGPQGVMGKQHYERGLQWVETYQAGHEQPMYQPKVAWRQLQWLLGRIDEL